MNNQTQKILNAITQTVAAILEGNFAQLDKVKRAVLHLETVYFCHDTCYLIGKEDLPIEEQLALYQKIGLVPQSTTTFFENNRGHILEFWPAEAALAERPECLYEALLANELCIRPDEIWFQEDKVSRDIAGAYYTSSDFSAKITRRAIDTYLEDKTGIAHYSFSPISSCTVYDRLGETVFLDYSCGCGEFLLSVMQYFENFVANYPLKKLATQLRGVDVDPIAVMISVARIVERAAGARDNIFLQEVAKNFLVGNPLLHTEQQAPLESRFDNFALNRLYAENEGINCLELARQKLIVLGNPPWEKIRLEEREFFRPLCPEISALSQKNKRAEKISALAAEWPELVDYYRLLQSDYEAMKKNISKHPLLETSLVGELNTYALFAELASRLVGAEGFAAIIVKSALVTSTCYSSCFRSFVDQEVLSEVFLYDNREKLFPIDSRETFCILFFGKTKSRTLDVHYGLVKQDEILEPEALHVTSEELTQINPETGVLPNVADSGEFIFLLKAHQTLSVFAKEFPQCHFGRLVHLTAHANYISTKPSTSRLPIYEGKFIEQYDNRFSTFAGMAESERYQAKASATRQNGDGFLSPKPVPECRYFIDRAFWQTFLNRYDQPYSLCWRSLTSPTNQRTMIATIMPSIPTCQSIQLLQTPSTDDLLLILALFNSKVFDYFVRLKMAGIDLTQSVVRQIPVPPKEAWKCRVRLNGVDYQASDAVKALEKLIYRNEPALNALWEGVQDIKDAEQYYLSGTDIREEIDRIIIQLYGLTSAEEDMVRSSFKKAQA